MLQDSKKVIPTQTSLCFLYSQTFDFFNRLLLEKNLTAHTEFFSVTRLAITSSITFPDLKEMSSDTFYYSKLFPRVVFSLSLIVTGASPLLYASFTGLSWLVRSNQQLHTNLRIHMFRPFLIYSLLDNYYRQRNKKPKFLICLFEKHWGKWYVFLQRSL